MADQERERWTKLVADFETSDLTQREFASERGISFQLNHKLVFRLYRAEGMAVRQKKRKRKRMAASLRVVPPPPTGPRQQWKMDFTQDSLSTGRQFRTPNLIDTFARECLLIEAGYSLAGLRVVRILEQLVERHGTPETIRIDNGTGFASSAVDAWAYRQGVRLDFITKG